MTDTLKIRKLKKKVTKLYYFICLCIYNYIRPVRETYNPKSHIESNFRGTIQRKSWSIGLQDPKNDIPNNYYTSRLT